MPSEGRAFQELEHISSTRRCSAGPYINSLRADPTAYWSKWPAALQGGGWTDYQPHPRDFSWQRDDDQRMRSAATGRSRTLLVSRWSSFVGRPTRVHGQCSIAGPLPKRWTFGPIVRDAGHRALNQRRSHLTAGFPVNARPSSRPRRPITRGPRKISGPRIRSRLPIR